MSSTETALEAQPGSQLGNGNMGGSVMGLVGFGSRSYEIDGLGDPMWEKWRATDHNGLVTVVALVRTPQGMYVHERHTEDGGPAETLTIGALPLEAMRELCEESYGQRGWAFFEEEVDPEKAKEVGRAMARGMIKAMEGSDEDPAKAGGAMSVPYGLYPKAYRAPGAMIEDDQGEWVSRVSAESIIDRMRRERDEARAEAERADAAAMNEIAVSTQSDTALRAEVERLRQERDDMTLLVAREQEWRRAAVKERDEARKENARGYMDALRGVRAEWREMVRAEQERAEALRAEVERLTRERDEARERCRALAYDAGRCRAEVGRLRRLLRCQECLDAEGEVCVMTRRKASELSKAELVNMIAMLRGELYEQLTLAKDGFVFDFSDTERILNETSFDDDLNETYSPRTQYVLRNCVECGKELEVLEARDEETGEIVPVPPEVMCGECASESGLVDVFRGCPEDGYFIQHEDKEE